MRSRELKRLFARYLAQYLPGFRHHGQLLFMTPIDELLRGFYFESSSFSKAFTIQVFVQPLFLPADSIYFLIGDRVGRLTGQAERWWELTAENEAAAMDEIRELLIQTGRPFLEQIKGPREVVDYFARRDPYWWQDPHRAETVAYCQIRLGQREQAIETLERLITVSTQYIRQDLAKGWDLPWLRELLERAKRMRQILARSLAEANALLDRYREETLNRLIAARLLPADLGG